MPILVPPRAGSPSSINKSPLTLSGDAKEGVVWRGKLRRGDGTDSTSRLLRLTTRQRPRGHGSERQTTYPGDESHPRSRNEEWTEGDV